MLSGLEMSYFNDLMPDQIGGEHLLFHILNLLELFTCQEHKEKGQKFSIRAVIKTYFNNKINLSNDSVIKDKVKTFKKKTTRKIILNKHSRKFHF